MATVRTHSEGRSPEQGKNAADDLTLGLPTYIGEDIDALRATARANLGLFTNLLFFHKLLRANGFVEEADRAEHGSGSNALSDRVLDAICLIGSVGRCNDRLAEPRAAGLDLPILWPGLGVDTAREVIAAFRQ